ncbi:MAG: hypothetical protein HY682_10480, partial [Chloroflexi bacterium]|nr:hypothetical protein [Chloroflexota bacterium]
LRYIGMGVRGEFCQEKRPSADFPHLHKYFAAKYGEGHGKTPGDTGYWLLVLAADEFKSGERPVTPGVDREFSKLEIPNCAK